ncbi:MAG: hypothetical protein ACI94Y_004118 [Maribacter sp.]|jgi:hypothetical protein
MKKKLKKYICYIILIISPVFIIHSTFRNRYISFLVTKPLSEESLESLKRYEPYLQFYSQKYDIPIEALSSAIGCEINRRIYTNKLIDIIQDYVFSTTICSNEFLEYSLQSNIGSRYLNFAKQDIGLGSIQVETAWNIFKLYPEEFVNIYTIKDMTNYLLTVQGNIHVASLVIMHAQNLFCSNKHYYSLNREVKSAVLYSYYKQGEKYYERYIYSSNGLRAPIPGGGTEIIEKLNTTLYKNNSRIRE